MLKLFQVTLYQETICKVWVRVAWLLSSGIAANRASILNEHEHEHVTQATSEWID